MQMRGAGGETVRLAQWQMPICYHTRNSLSAISFRLYNAPRDLHQWTWSQDAKSQQLLDRAPLHQLLSMPGRTERVHLDFFACQLFAFVCGDIGEQRSAVFTLLSFRQCRHLPTNTGLIVMDRYPPWLLKCKQEKVWHMGWHHPFPIKSHNFWFGRS